MFTFFLPGIPAPHTTVRRRAGSIMRQLEEEPVSKLEGRSKSTALGSSKNRYVTTEILRKGQIWNDLLRLMLVRRKLILNKF